MIMLCTFIYKPIKRTVVCLNILSVKDYWCCIFTYSLVTIFGLFNFVKKVLNLVCGRTSFFFYYNKTLIIFTIWVICLGNNTVLKELPSIWFLYLNVSLWSQSIGPSPHDLFSLQYLYASKEKSYEFMSYKINFMNLL